MCMKRRAIRLEVLLLTAMLGVVGAAAAQPGIAAPHPTMPWSQFSRPDYGQAIRYIEVPTQQIVLDMAVDVPAGVPPETRSQIVEIPGYLILETTMGYVIPEHWTVVQAGAGVFQWQRLPAEFWHK